MCTRFRGTGRSVGSKKYAEFAGLRCRVGEIAAVRDDLRAEIGSVRVDVQGLRVELYTVKDELKDGFARGLQQQTRSLFFGILGGIGTITAGVMVALRVAGKL